MPRTHDPAVARYYDRASLEPDERARAEQLERLYGFPFPTELFLFWRWYCGSSDEQRLTLHDTLGMRLVGPFDVLAGKFDGVDLTYPAVLHWRYRFDPPELVTVVSGDTDGLHWGYWFDDHARLPPVVASYYARDAFELVHAGDTLFDAVHERVDSVRESTKENLEDDPDESEAYLADLEAIAALETTLPTVLDRPRRVAVEKSDGMGVVEPTTAELLRGKELWLDDPAAAKALLEQAYRDLDRPVLAAIVKAHASHPILPSVSILDYPRGSFHSLERALATPTEVRLLQIADCDLAELPDLSALENLEELSLYGNALVSLPSTLGRCQRLRKINLFRNPMATVPAVLFDLPALEEVILPRGVPEAELDRLRAALPKAEIR